MIGKDQFIYYNESVIMKPLAGRDDMYETAANGGTNHGLLEKLRNQTDNQLNKSINSFKNNIIEHQHKIAKPSDYIENWNDRNENYKNGMIEKWKKDILRNKNQLDVALGAARERGL